MTDDDKSTPTTVSFPAFHERSKSLTQADESRVRLASAMRRLIHDSFMSTASVDNIDAAIRMIESATESVNVRGVAGTAAAESHFTDRSPFYGIMNPLSMPMTMDRDETSGEFGTIIGRALFTEPYEGPPGHVHGGYIAAAFDEVLGLAQSLTGRPGMTGKLSITYRSPTPLHASIEFKGWVERVDGRKIFAKGASYNGATLCAEAEGLFLSMPVELMDRLRKGRDLSGPANP
jgi:acyl-coenzyme A thioesterase PaaI-like protein